MLEPGMKKRAGAHKTAAALSVGISDMNLHICTYILFKEAK